MDLRTIRTFQAIVEHGSFQAAAQHLNYAQSTITSHIKKLESGLGVTLFDRNQQLQLTEAGRLLKEKGHFLLKSYESLERSLHDLIEGEYETVRLGVMEPMASYRLPGLLKDFAHRHPHIQISLQIQGSKVLTDMVNKQELEAAICASSAMDQGGIFEALFQEEVVLLVPEDHRLSGKEVVELADLQEERLVITNTFCPFRGEFENRMLESGYLPSYGLEVSNMLTLKYYVQSGFGPAIVPLVAVDPPPEGTRIKRIANFEQGLTVGILRKTDGFLSPSLDMLLRSIRDRLPSSDRV